MVYEKNPLPRAFIEACTKACLIALFLLGAIQVVFSQHYLQRSNHKLPVIESEISTESAHYKPIFGEGDTDQDQLEGVNRFGLLTLEPGGKSQLVDYGGEELVYYVLEGSGTLHYSSNTAVSISQDNYFYIPVHTKHSFTSTKDELVILVMGYLVPEITLIVNTEVQIADAQEVEFQTLEQLNHGVTSRFQLLLGTVESKRDRLAVAHQINSLFVIDFDPGGTNVPHRHPNEEEIYLVLQGKGDMVAGETSEGDPISHAARAGDAFFFSRNCLVGFYSSKKAKKPHTRILAIRSKIPDAISDE